MELEAVIRNVPFQWFGLQSELNTLTLKTLQGEKNNKISFLWSQVRPLSHCHSPTKGKTFMWVGWPRQNSHLVSSWRLTQHVKTVSSIRTPVGSWPLATLEMRKKLGRVSFRQDFWDRYWSPVIYWPIFLLTPVTFPAWPSGESARLAIQRPWVQVPL